MHQLCRPYRFWVRCCEEWVYGDAVQRWKTLLDLDNNTSLWHFINFILFLQFFKIGSFFLSLLAIMREVYQASLDRTWLECGRPEGPGWNMIGMWTPKGTLAWGYMRCVQQKRGVSITGCVYLRYHLLLLHVRTERVISYYTCMLLFDVRHWRWRSIGQEILNSMKRNLQEGRRRKLVFFSLILYISLRDLDDENRQELRHLQILIEVFDLSRFVYFLLYAKAMWTDFRESITFHCPFSPLKKSANLFFPNSFNLSLLDTYWMHWIKFLRWHCWRNPITQFNNITLIFVKFHTNYFKFWKSWCK